MGREEIELTPEDEEILDQVADDMAGTRTSDEVLDSISESIEFDRERKEARRRKGRATYEMIRDKTIKRMKGQPKMWEQKKDDAPES